MYDATVGAYRPVCPRASSKAPANSSSVVEKLNGITQTSAQFDVAPPGRSASQPRDTFAATQCSTQLWMDSPHSSSKMIDEKLQTIEQQEEPPTSWEVGAGGVRGGEEAEVAVVVERVSPAPPRRRQPSRGSARPHSTG